MTISIEAEVPDQTIRQYERAGIDWKVRARKLLEDGLPADAPALKQEEPDAKRAAAIAWFRSIAAEAAQMTDEEKAAAAAEDEELIGNLNAVRAENGERLL